MVAVHLPPLVARLWSARVSVLTNSSPRNLSNVATQQDTQLRQVSCYQQFQCGVLMHGRFSAFLGSWIFRPRPTGPGRHLLGQFHQTMATVTSESGSRGPVESAIHDKLTTLLQPSRLTITNDSHLHRHHASMRAQGGGNGETHFAVQIISEVFQGKTTLQRHRMIYTALSDELVQGLHALSLKTSTPDEARRLAAGQAE